MYDYIYIYMYDMLNTKKHFNNIKIFLLSDK